MSIELDLQYATEIKPLPSAEQFQEWVKATLDGRLEEAQLTVRIVDNEESAGLNETYRHRKGPTNVLSFPCEDTGLLQPRLLGDIVICAPLLVEQAHDQHKDVNAHWAHLVIHGVLHLLGYDHDNDEQAQCMEGLETSIMEHLGFTDPYAAEKAQQSVRA